MNGKLKDGHNQGIFSKIRTPFSIIKTGQGRPSLPPSCLPVSVAEYASISLNIPKYPWKCLNKLLWLCQDSEYAWSSYMFDKLLKMPKALNVPGLWISHCCICKGYTEFWIYLNMAQYASIMPGYTSICLNVPQYAWKWLNIAEYLWICLKMPE